MFYTVSYETERNLMVDKNSGKFPSSEKNEKSFQYLLCSSKTFWEQALLQTN